MSKTLFNPTKESFDALYEGISLHIAPFGEGGHKIPVHDSKANHILNSLGPRGLCVLEYGDESKEDQIAEDGRARNLEFKRKQVIRYNQMNERNKQTNLPYVEPPQQIKDYAVDIALKLLSPYETQDAKNQEIVELRKRNDDLSERMNELLRRMSVKLEEDTGVRALTDEEVKVRDYRQEFLMLNKPEFREYVEKNAKHISAFPIMVQEDLDAKWIRFFEGEPRPK